MKKVVSGIATVYHYDIAGNLIAETSAGGTPSRDIVYMNGERIAMKLYSTQAGWYFFVNDHLGTPQKIVDSSGTVVWAGFYLPFGKAWAYPATITNNFRFPGQYYDAETGLHYNWHRYYDPDTGRYVTADPIGLEGGINLYAYVMNNPVNLTDPHGLSTTTDVLMGIGWILAAVEPTVVGEALMTYISALRAGVAAANAAEMIMDTYGDNGGNKMCSISDNGKEPTNIYSSVKKSPKYPDGFSPRKNGTTANNVNNKELLSKLREIEPGKWVKVYKDGFDAYGNKISIHYFRSESGKVFDVWVKRGWSN